MADWTQEEEDFLSGTTEPQGFRGQPRRGMWRRFLDDVEDAAEYGFIGWTGRRISDALDTDRKGQKMRPGMTEEQRDNELALQTRFKRARMAARDRDDPTFLDKENTPVDARIGRAAQGLVGNILGGFSPTYALAPGSGPVSRSLGQGAVNAGEDIALQAADIYEGNEDDFDFLRTGVSGVAGTALQGAQEIPGVLRTKAGLEGVKEIGGKFGTVTSTIRTPERNKRVGGAKNSHHLRGNAIDIARGKGVSHGMLERAYRRAGYDIVESLDEGDHSHFAFNFKNTRKTPEYLERQAAIKAKGAEMARMNADELEAQFAKDRADLDAIGEEVRRAGEPILEDFDFRPAEDRADELADDFFNSVEDEAYGNLAPGTKDKLEVLRGLESDDPKLRAKALDDYLAMGGEVHPNLVKKIREEAPQNVEQFPIVPRAEAIRNRDPMQPFSDRLDQAAADFKAGKITREEYAAADRLWDEAYNRMNRIGEGTDNPNVESFSRAKADKEYADIVKAREEMKAMDKKRQAKVEDSYWQARNILDAMELADSTGIKYPITRKEWQEMWEVSNPRYTLKLMEEQGMPKELIQAQKDLISTLEAIDAKFIAREEGLAAGGAPRVKGRDLSGLGKGSVATTPVNDLTGPRIVGPLPERILAPAILHKDGRIYTGYEGGTHSGIINQYPGLEDFAVDSGGFITPDGRYLTREEAAKFVGSKEKGLEAASYAREADIDRTVPPPSPMFPPKPGDKAAERKWRLAGNISKSKLFGGPDTPDNASPKGDDKKWAGSVNLDRMDISKAAKEHLRTLARGIGTDTRTHEQTKAEAQALLDQYGVDDLIRRTDMPQSEVPAYNTAIRAVDAAAARKVVNLSKAALDPEKSTPAVLAQLDEARLLSAAAYERANEVSGLAGRILDAQKITVGRGNLNRDVNKLIQTMAGNNVDTLDFARLIQAHEEQAGKIASDSLRPNAEEMLASLWYNWRLSGITTQVANTVGTASHLALDMITRLADSMVPGQNRTTLGELGERLFGLYVGAKQAVTKLEGEVQLVGHKDKKTVTPVGFAFNQGTPLDLRGKIDTGRAFKSKAGGLLEIPTRSMAAVDEFFRNIAVTSELYGAAFRQARSEGLEGDAFKARLEELVANPSREMEDSAIEYGRRMRFADEASRPTRAMEGLRHAAKNDDYIQRAGAFVLRMMVPFVHTLDRLTAAAFGHSPLGFVNRVNRQGLRKGGHDRRLAASRMAVGTLIVLGAALKAANGEITGAGPTDYRRREQLESSGWQPYSIRVGDTYYSIRTLQPISTILGTVATMVEQEKLEGKDKGTLDKIARLAKSVGKAAMSGAWTESLAGVLATADEKSNSKLANWIASVADPSPTILRQINQGYVDTKVRDTTGDGSLGDRVTGRMKASVPGLSDDLPQKHDTYGRPIENQGALGPDIASPLKQKKVDKDVIVQEIERLTGDSKTALVNPPRKDEMSAAEYQQYRKIAGDNFMFAMEEHFIGDDWDFLEDEEKREVVKKELERARKSAREELSDGWDF